MESISSCLLAVPVATAAAGAAVGVLLLVLLTRASSGSGGRRKKKYPPLVGTIFHQLVNFRRLHDYHTEISREHKNYRLFSPLGQQIYTTEPQVVEYILKTNFHNFGKGSYNYENMKDLLGDGIFAVDGDKWRHQRKLASFNFSTRALRDFSGAIFKTNAAKLARLISSYADSCSKFNIQDLFFKSTMDSIFRIGFGSELNCLEGSDLEGYKFAQAFDDSNEFIMLRYVNVFWRIMRFLNIGTEATLKRRIKVVDDFVYKVINARMQQIAKDDRASTPALLAVDIYSDSKCVQEMDILSKFIEDSRENPEKMDAKYLRDIILNFVIAGKDTTAGTLSWFFYLICANPSAQEKIHDEVMRVVTAEAGHRHRSDAAVDFESFAESITDESLNGMHYLHAALSETLRLFPAVPLENKVCFSEDILPGGYSVRKGDIVFYLPYAMGRMEYLWGEDAGMFRPERWLDAQGIFQPESPFKFSAFQAGPRICLGKEFAYRQMKIFAAVLLRFFSLKLGDEEKTVHYRTTMTLHIDGGLYLEAFPRGSV